MFINPEIVKAIKDAAQEQEQPEVVADALIALLNEMAGSELSTTEKISSTEISDRLNAILESIDVTAILDKDENSIDG